MDSWLDFHFFVPEECLFKNGLCSQEEDSSAVQSIAMRELGVTCSEVMKGKTKQWITKLQKPLLTSSFVEY